MRVGFLVAVHGILRKQGKILLLKRKNTGYMDGYWSVPAGHVDGGEKISEAMEREIAEEVGVGVSGASEPALVMHRIKKSTSEERIDFFYIIDDWEGELVNAETEKCEEIRWFGVENFPEKMIGYVKFGIDQIEQDKRFCEYVEV